MRTKLKIFRIQNRMNQQQIAARLGYGRAYYGHVERGADNGSAEFWGQLQLVFGLTEKDVEELKKVDE